MKVIFVYKNFAANKNISHIGLGVAALNTQKSLIAAGIRALVYPIVNSADLRATLIANPDTTHIIISAPWIPTQDMQAIVRDYPKVAFAMICHSNVGFLQADSNGVRIFREAMEIEQATHNFHVGGNNQVFCTWATRAYSALCTWLPNLYFLDGTTNVNRPLWSSGPIRIGAFGATRVLKNFMTAAGAAINIAQGQRADLEFWMSSERAEGGEGILNAVRQLLAGVPHAKLVLNGWQSWPAFRQTVGNMHLLIQVSYTESFNMVTADGISRGVPSVVSDAIDWVPDHWTAKADDANDVERVGAYLIQSRTAAHEGLTALQNYNRIGMAVYKQYLQSSLIP